MFPQDQQLGNVFSEARRAIGKGGKQIAKAAKPYTEQIVRAGAAFVTGGSSELAYAAYKANKKPKQPNVRKVTLPTGGEPQPFLTDANKPYVYGAIAIAILGVFYLATRKRR